MGGLELGKPQSRIRFLTLILLWAWVAAIGIVIDLFFDVEALEEIRPRSDAYRYARIGARDLVMASDPDLSESYSAARPVRLVSPPEAFRGTEKEWRLSRDHHAVDARRDALRDLGGLKPRERTALLRALHIRPDTELAGELAEAIENIPNDAPTLIHYGAASAATLRALALELEMTGPALGTPGWEDPRVRALSDKRGYGLVEGLMTSLAMLLQHAGPTMPDRVWTGATQVMERIERSIPAFREYVDVAAQTAEIDASLVRELARSTEPRRGYRGGVPAVEFAARFGGESALEACIECIRARERVLPKLPRPREESLAQLITAAANGVIDRGTVGNLTRLTPVLLDALAGESREPVRVALWESVYRLFLVVDLSAATKQQFIEARASSPAESGMKARVLAISEGRDRRTHYRRIPGDEVRLGPAR